MSVSSRERRLTQQRAKGRALTRLARAHIVELRAMYAEELEHEPPIRVVAQQVGALDELTVSEGIELEHMLYDLGKRRGRT